MFVKSLKYYCISYKIVDWVNSFLTNRKQRAVINSTPSLWHDEISGTPQGSVLGSTPFVIYINTLIELVKYWDLFLFGDDHKLYKIIQTKLHSSLLQYDTDSIFKWTLNSLLLIHPKCFTMRAGSKSTGSVNQATRNDNILENKLEFKDLGVIVNEHLTLRNHFEEKVNKNNQINTTLILLYNSLVKPHIEYGHLVWSTFWKGDINLFEIMQRRATRFIPEVGTLDYQD